MKNTLEIKKLSDTNLKKWAYDLYASLYITECFGSNDILLYELVYKELEKRGFEISENQKLKIEKID